MDTRNGQIHSAGAVSLMRSERQAYMNPMSVPPTTAQMRRDPPRVGRNDTCPCGSGKKYKRCCLTLTRR